MKKKMPSEGLRLGRDSGSILCDTLKKWRFRTGWGGVDLAKKIIRMIVLTDSHYGEAQPGFWFIKSLFHGALLVCLLTVAANKLRIKFGQSW